MIDSGQSEFNMAVSYLNRLNYWFLMCDEASSKMDIYSWLQTLLVIFRELSTEIKETELPKKQECLHQLFIDINNIRTRKNRQSIINPSLYWKLNDFEIYLRQVMDKAGLQTKRQTSAMAALK